MRISCCILAVLLLPVATATGRDILVNNSAGEDSFTGENLQSLPDGTGPVQTIGRALQLAHSGDRIVVVGTEQPYHEEISLVGSRHGALGPWPLVIEGNGAVLDGSAAIPPSAWKYSHGAVFRFCPPTGGHQQLFLDGRPVARVATGSDDIKPPELKPLQWCLFHGEILFCVGPGKLPEDYNLSYALLQTGITLLHVHGVVIANLTVQGFRIDGISAHNSAREITISGVTARGNGRSGITVGGASQVEINGCVLGNNGEAQLLTLPYGETSVRGTQLFANTAPSWVDQGGRVYLDGKQVKGGLNEDMIP